jgi:hypothetical protein
MLFFWLGVVVVYTCNNSTRESYPEGSYIGGHAGLHTEFEARLEYVASHCLKKKKIYIYIYIYICIYVCVCVCVCIDIHIDR